MIKLFILLAIFSWSIQTIAEPIVYNRPLLQGIGTFDTKFFPTESHAFIYRQVFDSLVRITNEGEIQSNLAEHWKISPDGKTISFFIRKNVQFHDGSILNTKDVKYSIERVLESDSAIREVLISIKRITLGPDPQQLNIVIASPNPHFIIRFADSFLSILKTNETSNSLNGTGPFKVAKRSATALELVPNLNYFGGRPLIDRFILTVMSKSEAISQFQNKKMDDLFFFPMTADERKMLKSSCSWIYEDTPTIRFIVLKSNSNPILADRKTRSCILNLVNHEEYIQNTAPGQKAITTLLNPLLFGGNFVPKIPIEKGCDEKDYQKIALESATHPIRIAELKNNTPELSKGPPLLASYLNSRGIKTKLVGYPDAAEFFKAIATNNLDFFSARFSARAPETEAFLYLFSSLFGANYEKVIGVDHRSWTRVLDQLEKESDRAVRAQIMGKLLNMIAESFTFVPLHSIDFAGCYQPGWQNVSVPSTGYIDQNMVKVSK